MKTLTLTPALYQYLLAHTRQPHQILERVRRETSKHAYARMQIAAEQGNFMAFLARLIGASRYVEVGCFTGYSAIAVASALPPGGKAYTLDINPETTRIATDFFAEAGLKDRIHVKLGDAKESLAQLITQEGPGAFDMAFIDADKTGIPDYYEKCLTLLRPGGLLLVDNVLWSGHVADPSQRSPDTEALRAINAATFSDPRVDMSLLNIADGLLLIRKRFPGEI